MRNTLYILAITLLAACIPGAAGAQEQEPEIRTLTITGFTIPQGKGQKFNEYVDKYVMPAVQADPDVLSFRLARHHWGAGDFNAWFIAEYESLEGLYRSEQFQSDWFDEQFPEGTPEREAADKATEEDFLPFFAVHTDEITAVNMSRAK